MTNVYREKDADRVVVLISSDGGVTWVPDVDGGAGGGGGGGAVDSVDGRTGTVTLTDLYDAAGDADAAQLAAEAASDPIGTAATAAAAAVVTAEAYADVKHALVLKIASNLSDLASPSTARTNLGLGTAATTAASAYDVAGAAAAAQAASQPLDADLTTIAALTALTDSFIVAVGSAWAARTPTQVKATLAIAESDVTSLVSDLALKAALAGPAFTGNPTAPTQTAGNNSTRLATTAYADTGDNAILSSAQSYVNSYALPLTLANGKIYVGNGSGIAVAVTPSGDITISNTAVATIKTDVALAGSPTTTTQSPGDSSTKIATTAYADAIATLKANLASPTFTGTPAAPTATAGTNTTQLATTAFVTTAVAAVAGDSPGVVKEYAGSSAPAGYVMCDGTSYLRLGAMAALFAVIGTTFGAVDGTHFNVPDHRDREAIGASGTHALGSTGGNTTQAISHTLAAPSHAHGLSVAYAMITPIATAFIAIKRLAVTGWTDTHISTVSSAATASGSGRTTAAQLGGATDGPSATALTGSITSLAGPLDPFIAMNFIIKT